MKESVPTPPSNKRPPSPVRVSVAPQGNGHVKVVVRVRPVSDVDVEGGVFVDLIHAATDRATRLTDMAAARLERRRLVAVHASGRLTRLAPPARWLPSRRRVKRTNRASHKIAPAQRLVTGQSETFRSEIVLPPIEVDGWSWFARGRFASAEGTELRSKWTRVT